MATKPNPNDERDVETQGITDSGSDVDEVRNEVPPTSSSTSGMPDQTPEQPKTEGSTDRPVREPGMGPGDEVRFDHNPAITDNDATRPGKAGLLGAGMFLPVIIIIVIAVIIILWIAL